MAYRNSTFYPVGNQSGRDHAAAKYIYRTDDSIASITASGYFADIKSRLSMGDQIEVQFVTFNSATDDGFSALHGKANIVVAYKDDDVLHVMEVAEGSAVLFGTLTDVSTAGTALGGGAATDGNLDLVSNMAGRVTKIVTVLGGSITVADAAVTAGNETTTAQFLNDDITVAFTGSAKGDVDSASPNGDNLVAVGDTIRLTSDGGSTTAQSLYVMVEVEAVKQEKHYITAYLADVSTAGQIFVPVPFAGNVTNIWTSVNGVLATSNATLTAKIEGVAITGGTITIAQGGAAGDVDSAKPTAANTVAVGNMLEMETDGASTGTHAVQIIYEITAN